ncbi:alcohol dehydrogenase catalytic domain-containing protein [Ammoniphilus resinae]|uniref:2-desacetyl-2-hydroxyethyl bacteriochlorophyllide A dehydrogenase n=1 Tax=Ammoniphilus resinae TaxID=861532 RepID=A0ABS4GTC2_9BACL|nr:zinc-binding dehydrogenase [Ammoniphilus resinae]MBP1933277.1 2-desacetyl-2-hydroxyethyl bacteriochlorophyllide A dehydrogenase [Ammoniphilus resinae]
MRAAILKEFVKPMILLDIPEPEPKPGEVVIKVKACGICHTDVSIWEGKYPPRKPLPMVLGHELSGEVISVGANVKSISNGQRVVVYNLLTCGICENCKNGRENLCFSLQTLGIDTDGAFKEYITVPEKNCLYLPESVSWNEGAVITDAVSTPFHAIERSNIKMGQNVIIYGIGALGLNAVQIASKLRGANVIAVDITDEKLEWAKEFGAIHTINSLKENLIESIKDLTSGRGADCALEFVGLEQTYQQAIGSVRTGGKVTIVGATRKPFMVDPYRFFKEEVQLSGSYGYLRSDLEKVLELVSNGKLDVKKSVSHQVELQSINEGFQIAQDPLIHSLRVVVSL